MERLTRLTPYGYVFQGVFFPALNAEMKEDRLLKRAAKALYEYEDTGLTPADIAALQAENKRLQGELSDLRGQIERGEIKRKSKQTEPTKGWVYDRYNQRPTEVIVRTNEIVLCETWVTDTQGQFQTTIPPENIYPTKEALLAALKP
jgi:hypothetical protein